MNREVVTPESPWPDRIAAAVMALAFVGVFLAGYARGMRSVESRPRLAVRECDDGQHLAWDGREWYCAPAYRDVTISDGHDTSSLLAISGNTTLEDNNTDAHTLKPCNDWRDDVCSESMRVVGNTVVDSLMLLSQVSGVHQASIWIDHTKGDSTCTHYDVCIEVFGTQMCSPPEPCE